jgi:terminase small subunit-like protein
MSKKLGRPSKYTEELAKHICDIIASSHYSVRKLCKIYDEFPHIDTIQEWKRTHESFSVQYATSLEKQASALFEGAIEELEELEDYVYENPVSGACEINSGIVAMKKALADKKSRHAAILSPKYRLEKSDGLLANKDETIDKFQDIVDAYNKRNKSEL